MSQGELFPSEIKWTVIPHESGQLAVLLTRPDDMQICLAGDVIQLDPADGRQPLLAIVTTVHDWGVQCLATVPDTSEPGGVLHFPVPHGHYWRIGKACWKLP